ncbi:MAG: hypothetical protein QOH04_2603 [Sphingomonadales bacterium]|nr:hypothetical protein [Sphingomonadales bacterium]
MRLSAWRREEGLTQEELAQQLGCTQPYISDLERKNRPSPPSSDFLDRLYRLSRGAVTPNDVIFPYGLPDIDTPELQLEAPAPLLDVNARPGANAIRARECQDLAA